MLLAPHRVTDTPELVCDRMDGLPGRRKETAMSKRGRKRKARRKNGANHGKRPNS